MATFSDQAVFRISAIGLVALLVFSGVATAFASASQTVGKPPSAASRFSVEGEGSGSNRSTSSTNQTLADTQAREEFAISSGNISLGPPGGDPRASVYDNQTGDLFIPESPGFVRVLSSTSYHVLATINLGTSESESYPNPNAIAFDPETGDVFVASNETDVSVISGSTLTVIDAIHTNQLPDAILYDPHTGDIWVASWISEGITIIDATNLTVVAEIRAYWPLAMGFDTLTNEVIVGNGLGLHLYAYAEAVYDTNFSVAWSTYGETQDLFDATGPYGVACDSQTGEIFLTYDENSTLILWGRNGTVASSISAGAGVEGIVYDNATQTMFVAQYDDNSVGVIDASTNRWVGNISAGVGPWGVTFVPESGVVVVVDSVSNALSIVNGAARAIAGTISLGGNPAYVTVDSWTGDVWALDYRNLIEVSPIDLAIVESIPIGSDLGGLTFDNQTGDLLVTSDSNNTLVVISGNSTREIGFVNLDSDPLGVAVDSKSGDIYVACYTSGFVDVIASANLSLIDRIRVGLGPVELSYLPIQREIAVSDFLSSNISIISDETQRVVATVNLPSNSDPALLATDEESSELFVPDTQSGNLTVISLPSDAVVKSVWLGGQPFAATYAPAFDAVFVSNLEDDDVWVVNVTSLTFESNLPVGIDPLGDVYDDLSDIVYVANNWSNSLTFFVPGAHPTTLPTATLSIPTVGDLVGASVPIWLNVTGTQCGGSTTSGQYLVGASVQFGDGNSSSFTIPRNISSCSAPPWTESLHLTHAYGATGSFIVAARAIWEDGFSLFPSALVQIFTNVTSSSNSTGPFPVSLLPMAVISLALSLCVPAVVVVGELYGASQRKAARPLYERLPP